MSAVSLLTRRVPTVLLSGLYAISTAVVATLTALGARVVLLRAAIAVVAAALCRVPSWSIILAAASGKRE